MANLNDINKDGYNGKRSILRWLTTPLNCFSSFKFIMKDIMMQKKFIS